MYKIDSGYVNNNGL